jgi:hypothetical protein
MHIVVRFVVRLTTTPTDNTMIVTLRVSDLREIVRIAVAETLAVKSQHDLIDLKQVAERCRVGRGAIIAAARRGEIALSQGPRRRFFASRSALDMLARFVAAHISGTDGLHSYRKLVQAIHGSIVGVKILPLVEEAWGDWAADLTERRDAAGHYVALVGASLGSTERRTFELRCHPRTCGSCRAGKPGAPDRAGEARSAIRRYR